MATEDLEAAEPAAPPPQPPGKPEGRSLEVTDEMRAELLDAMELLEYAVAQAYICGKSDEGPTKLMVSQSLITDIKAFAAAIQAPRENAAAVSTVALDSWVSFETAYNKLAGLVCPVTIQTLRDTGEKPIQIPMPGLKWLNPFVSWVTTSRATTFSKMLWLATICFAVMVGFGEWWVLRYGQPEQVQGLEKDISLWIKVIAPMNYGGLGACAFLLRSAHRYIHERTFDIRRRPEYWSRILLGVVSGSAIAMLVQEGFETPSGPVRLSTAALGFLGGYSTDLLFNTVERITNAILPKVGIDTVRRASAPSAPAVDMSLKELVSQYEAAKDPDAKALLRALIKQLYKVETQ